MGAVLFDIMGADGIRQPVIHRLLRKEKKSVEPIR